MQICVLCASHGANVLLVAGVGAAVNLFVSQTARDYDMPYDIALAIYNSYPKNYYDKLEEYIKKAKVNEINGLILLIKEPIIDEIIDVHKQDIDNVVEIY